MVWQKTHVSKMHSQLEDDSSQDLLLSCMICSPLHPSPLFHRVSVIWSLQCQDILYLSWIKNFLSGASIKTLAKPKPCSFAEASGPRFHVGDTPMDLLAAKQAGAKVSRSDMPDLQFQEHALLRIDQCT